jgi:hypothetical protein
VLYEAVRENLATLLAEASDVGRGLPRYGVRCGGRLKGLGVREGGPGVRAILEHRGLPTACARWAPARGPPQAVGC